MTKPIFVDKKSLMINLGTFVGSDVTKLLASLLASQGSNLSQDVLLPNEDHDSILLSQPASHSDTDEEEQEMSQVFSDDLISEPNEQYL